MPASLFREVSECHNSNSTLEDQRALQLALELSMLGLSADSAADALAGNFDPDSRSKKSQNTTECVPVPSSEHVAEIVGRQGCKIKALRAKTNTYIKTPVRGEEPVFVVTGRKEDVSSAKREILSAAEHFSQIRAQRKNNLLGGGGLMSGNGTIGLSGSNEGTLTGPGPNATIPGQVTIQVRVPYRVVGLVVGPKGATIKRIQQQTNTYIITPSRDKEPIFEVTGLPEMVDQAKKEIEAHIAIRTGGIVDGSNNPSNTNGSSCDSNSAIDGMVPNLNFDALDSFSSGTNCDSLFQSTRSALSSLYRNVVSDQVFGSSNNPFSNSHSGSGSTRETSPKDIFTFGSSSTSKFADLYSSFANNNNSSNFSTFASNLYESDESSGLGDSPTFDALMNATASSNTNTVTSSVWPEFGSSSVAGSNGINGGSSRAFGSERRNSSDLTSSCCSSSSSSANGLCLNDPCSESPLEQSSVNMNGAGHNSRRLSANDPIAAAFSAAVGAVGIPSSAASASLGAAFGSSSSTTTSSSPTESMGSLGSLNGAINNQRKSSTNKPCIVCFEGDICAALIPCGHNMFCMECALRVCGKNEPSCPVCQQPATQAFKIIS